MSNTQNRRPFVRTFGELQAGIQVRLTGAAWPKDLRDQIKTVEKDLDGTPYVFDKDQTWEIWEDRTEDYSVTVFEGDTVETLKVWADRGELAPLAAALASLVLEIQRTATKSVVVPSHTYTKMIDRAVKEIEESP